ncbi:hypothetical protein [Kitasatospora sp. HPMI-4]|uniref:hypothetical protein n=1 Tax=Kitasatospora sp. HPMI-4 TaxID=3448443 RepID=UPI003F1BA87F
MSRRVIRSRRSRRRGKPSYRGLLPWLLSLPARLRVRWALIALVMVTAMGAYGYLLVSAPPMPPSRAPSGVSGDGAARPAAGRP